MSTSTVRQVLALTACISLILLTLGTGVQSQSSLSVTPSATQVEVGDVITVEGVINVGINTGILGLVVETAPSTKQDENQPIFTPARPEPISLDGLQRATFTLTAVRPGTVTFYMTASGDRDGGVTEDGIPFTSTYFYNERSVDVTVVGGPTEPVQIPEPLTITLFGAGVAGIAGYARRKRQKTMDTAG